MYNKWIIMKSKKNIVFTILLFCLINSASYSQDKAYYYVFNTLNYFAPADKYFSSKNETSYEKTEVIIDFKNNKIIIKVNYSDGIVESIYTINKISELIYSQSDGQFYRFTCFASNNAEAVIDISKDVKWVRRKISHNGITHRFYNR